MRVTIQVHIKQLNPLILPPALPVALFHWPPNLTYSVTHREKVGWWLHGSEDHTPPPSLQLSSFTRINHWATLIFFLACNSVQLHSLSLTWMSEEYEIQVMWDMGTAPSAVMISITQTGLREPNRSPLVRAQVWMAFILLHWGHVTQWAFYKLLNCSKLLKGKPYLDYPVLRKCLWIDLNTSEQVFSISTLPFFLG